MADISSRTHASLDNTLVCGVLFGLIAGAMAVIVIVIAGFGPAVTNRRLEAIAA